MDKVPVLSEQGTPYIVVSCAALWSLVEYLSVVRVHVAYSYQGEEFRVAFSHHDLAAVEQIVSDWYAYSRGASAEQGDPAESGRSLENAHR